MKPRLDGCSGFQMVPGVRHGLRTGGRGGRRSAVGVAAVRRLLTEAPPTVR